MDNLEISRMKKVKEHELLNKESQKLKFSYEQEGWDYREEYQQNQKMSLAKHYLRSSSEVQQDKLMKKLNEGPPQNASFMERIKWKNNVKKSVAAQAVYFEENQRAFLENVREDQEYLDMKLNGRFKYEWQNINEPRKVPGISIDAASEYFCKVLRLQEQKKEEVKAEGSEEIQEESKEEVKEKVKDTEAEAFKLRKLIREDARGDFPNYDTIENFMHELNGRIRTFGKKTDGLDAKDMQEDAKKMYMEYCQLNLKTRSAFAEYMKDECIKEPRSCYMFMYHSLLMHILNTADNMSPDKLDFTQYGKLYARVTSTGRILARMCADNDFKEKRNKIKKDETERIKYEALQEAKEIFWKYGSRPGKEPLDLSFIRPYRELALYGVDKTLLKEMELDKYIEFISAKQEFLRKNIEALDNYKDDFLYETYGGEIAKSKVRERCIKNSRLDIFNRELTTEEIEETIEKSREQILSENKELTQRREYLDKKEIFKKYPDLYAIPEIKKLFEFKELDYFKKQVHAWSKNAEANEKILDIVIEQKIPFYCRENFKTQMIQNGAQVLIFGNPEQVEYYAKSLYRKLRVRDLSIAEYEKNLKKTMKKAGIPSYYHQTLLEQLEEGKVEEQIRTFKENIQEQPKEILKYQSEKSVFQTYTEEELYENLCTREEFDGILVDRKQEVLSALDVILKNKELPYPFLREVSSIKELKVLRMPEFQILMERLRSNIVTGLAEWEAIDGVYSEEIKKNLLPQLLSGKLTKESIEAGKIDEKKEEVQKNLFEMILEDKEKEPEIIRYRYLDTKEGKKKGISLAESRLKHFQHADLVWEELRKERKDEQIWEKCLNGTNEEIYGELEAALGISKNPDKIIDISYARKMTSEVEQKFSYQKVSLRYLVESLKEHIDEFCLFGVQDVVFNKAENKEMFAGGEEKEYQKKLQESSRILRSRMMDLEKIFQKHSVRAEDKRKYYLKMREMIGGIDAEENKNKENFGVKDWNDVKQKLENYLSEKKNLAETKPEIQEFIEKKEEREEILENYQEGILKPVLGQLLQNIQFKTVMLTGSDADFANVVKEIGTYLEVPLREMMKSYGYKRDNNPETKTTETLFVLQMAEEYWKEMLGDFSSLGELIEKIVNGEKIQGKLSNAEARNLWKNKFDEYFKAYSDHKIGKTSISKMMEDILKEQSKTWNKIKRRFHIQDDEIKKYLNIIILHNPYGVTVLQEQASFKSILSKAAEKLRQNMESLDEFLKAETESVSQINKEGFRMSLQKELVLEDAEMFKNELNIRYEKFQKDTLAEKEKTEEAIKNMSEKREIMAAVEKRKRQGRECDGNYVLTQTEELYRQSNIVESPILVAWGRTDAPSYKEIVEANKNVNQNYGNEDAVVKAILAERLLTKVSEDELNKEAAWLSLMHMKMRDKGLDPAQIMELLMFSYISQKAKGWEEVEHWEEETIKNTLNDNNKKLRNRKKRYAALEDVRKISSDKRCQQAVQAMRLDQYVGDDFEQKADTLVIYFKRLEQVRPIFEKAIKEKVQDKEQHIAIFHGLEECFREKLLPDIQNKSEEKSEKLSEENLKEITAEVNQLLEDERTHSYICNSEHLLESISWDSITEYEKANRGFKNRQDFEKVLSGCEDDKLLAQYNALDVPYRQVFALELCRLKDNVELLTGMFVKTKEEKYLKNIEIENQIQEYINQKRDEFEADYNLAISRIQKADGSIDSGLFKEAMKRTHKQIEKINQKAVRDYVRLADAEESLSFVRKEKGLGTEHTAEAESFEELLKKLEQESLGKDKQKLMEQMKSLKSEQQVMLAGILQDRTILDMSLQRPKEVVNKEKRASLKKTWSQNEFEAYKTKTTSETWKQISTVLMSYQVRDDIKIGKRELQKGDFTEEVWNRSDVFDWELLKRALDFLKEIQEEQLKQTEKKYDYSNQQEKLEHMSVYREKKTEELEIAVPTFAANLALENIYSNYHKTAENFLDDDKLRAYCKGKYKREWDDLVESQKYMVLDELRIRSLPEIFRNDNGDLNEEAHLKLYTLFSRACKDDRSLYMLLLKNRKWMDDIEDISKVKNSADVDNLNNEELKKACHSYFRSTGYLPQIWGEEQNVEVVRQNEVKALYSLFTTKGKSIQNTDNFVSEMMTMVPDFERDTVIDWKLLQKITKFVNQMRNEKFADDKVYALEHFLKKLHPEDMVTSKVLEEEKNRKTYEEFKKCYNSIKLFNAKRKEDEPQQNKYVVRMYDNSEEFNIDVNRAEADAACFGKTMLERFQEAFMGPQGVNEYIEATYLNKDNMEQGRMSMEAINKIRNDLMGDEWEDEKEKMEAYREMFGYSNYEQMKEEAGNYWINSLMQSVVAECTGTRCRTMATSILWNLGLLEEVKDINEESAKKVYDAIKKYEKG